MCYDVEKFLFLQANQSSKFLKTVAREVHKRYWKLCKFWTGQGEITQSHNFRTVWACQIAY